MTCPLLSAAQSARAIQWNAQQLAGAGVDVNHVRTDLGRYVSPFAVRLAIVGFNQKNPSAAIALGTPPVDAVFVESVHQFQAKCFFEASQIDGLAGESTLDSLGIFKRRGMNSADRANSGAVARLRKVDVPSQTGQVFTADNWFDSMVNPSFLGWRFTKGGAVRGVHLILMRRLRDAERALLAQARYAGMNPVELGGALGFSTAAEEHKGARPGDTTSASMHTYGLAVDVLYTGNPWVKGRDFSRALARSALLISGEIIAHRTSASYFESLRAGRTTGQIFDALRRRDQDFRTYMRLPSDRPRLLQLLQQRRAAATPGVIASAETDDQAASRWLRDIASDLAKMEGAGSPFRSGTVRDPRNGFLNLCRDLVVALRDNGCLAWGAVDIGPGEAGGNGDMMHFDARVGGLGDRLAEVGRNKRVEADHPCLAR